MAGNSLTAAITWSALAKVDEITRSDGRIVPDDQGLPAEVNPVRTLWLDEKAVA